MAVKTSIGSVNGVVREPQTQRYKGIDTDRAYTRKDIDSLMLRIDGHVSDVRTDPDASRLSVRAVVPITELGYLKRGVERFGASMEAVIVISRSDAIAYMGYNEPHRIPSQAEFNEYNNRINTARQASDYDIAAALRATRRAGFEVEVRLGGEATALSLAPSLTSMLQPFGYTVGELTALLRNTSNTIGVTRDSSGMIIGSAIIESAEVQFSDKSSIRIAELTDARVLRHAGGRDIYLSMSTQMVSAFMQNAGNIDALYAESNLGSQPVLTTAARQGRKVAGVLPMNSVIDGAYESFLVNHFTPPAITNLTNIARQ